jgi:putative ABC transport system permease protein
MSQHIPFVSFGGGRINWEGGNPDEKINCRFNEVGYDFVENMGKLLYWGVISPENSLAILEKACLINEVAAKCFGWDNPIGKRLYNNQFTVVGVLKNYIYKDMHNGVEPAVLTLQQMKPMVNGLCIRIDPNRRKQAMSILTREFEETFPNDPFEFRDLATTFNNENAFKIYHAVNRTIIFFTVFNIFLAMIGLLGLVSYTIARKTKEIGVRKISGSSSLNIFYLLSFEYISLLFVSLIVAIPAAWLVYEWIPGANKMHLKLWVCGASVIVLLIIVLLTTSYQTIKAAARNPWRRCGMNK